MREQVLVALLVIFLVKATHTVLTSGTTSLVKSRSCMTPPMEDELRCNVKLHRYYYGGQNYCHPFLWNGCIKEGVYEMRVDCVLNCNAGLFLLCRLILSLLCDQGPGICTLPAANKCTTDNKEGHRDRYFYNENSRTCEKYQMCGVAGEEFAQNSFGTQTLCLMHCSGFPVNEETKKDAERRRSNNYARF